MLQRIKIDSFSQDFTRAARSTIIIINWKKVFFVAQCIVLLLLPIGAIALSIGSEYLFLKEILSASFLMVLILFIKVMGERN